MPDVRRAALALLALLVALTLLHGGAALAAAQSSSASVGWPRYDVDLTPRTDGSLAVAETQTIASPGTLQHGYRVVPLARTSGVTDVQVAEVVDGREQAYTRGSNRPGTFSTAQDSGNLSIDWWFAPATNVTRTFVIRYVAHDVLRQYDAGDQLQWQAVYADRAGPVQAGRVVVHLLADTAADAPSALYLISAGGSAPREVGAATALDARTVQFTLPALDAGTGAEVRLQLPHGLITAAAPGWQADADRADWVRQSVTPILNFVALMLTLGIVAGGGTALFVLWYGRGREPAVGPVPARLAEPPSDLPAPLAGTLVDGSADVQDAIAALVDLGERGVLTLEPASGDVRVRLHHAVDDPALRAYERVLLTALFDSGASEGEILLSAARTRFAAAVPILAARLHAAVAEEGYFVENPDRVRRRYTTLGAAILAAGIVIAGLSAIGLGWAAGAIWLPGAALALVGFGLILAARAMPRRTPGGAVEAARWRAFAASLRETDRREPAYLAYAVAFGLDHRFLKQLEEHGSPPPRWYGGSPVYIGPGGWYGGQPRSSGSTPDSPGGPGTTTPSPQGWSDGLANLLTTASDALAHGGGGSGGWSGGSWGGGGGGGGGSGGFN